MKAVATSGECLAARRAGPALDARPRRRDRAIPRSTALLLAFAALLLAAGFATPSPAEEAKEIHGSGDAFAATGAALAWAVLRGADEPSTQVVLRIVADPQVYTTVVVAAKNPFSGRERVLERPIPTTAKIEVRVPRTQFADFPRTELRFYAPGSTAAPALVVYYAGVPDTTPEFVDAGKLDAYLDERIARARAGGRTP